MNPLQVTITKPTTPQSIQMEAQARRRLAEQSPSQTNRALVDALAQRYGLSKKGRGWIGIGEPDFQMVAIDGMDVVWHGDIDAVHLALTPPDDEMIEQALAILEVQTKRRAEDDQVASLGLRVYVNGLKKYPADVVLEVLRRWPEKSTWAPSWKELFDDLEALTQPRRNLFHSVTWSQDKPTPKPTCSINESGKTWDEAPVLTRDPSPPVRSAANMLEALRNISE
jgi:hypothetical protein